MSDSTPITTRHPVRAVALPGTSGVAVVHGDEPMGKKKPWRKFYPSDWLGEHLLAQCSLGAHGLWIKMCCIAWTSEREGYVQKPDGTPLTADDLAGLCRETPGQVRRYLDELRSKQVLSEDESGCFYSRRIVRDALQTAVSSEYGKQGGNPKLSGRDKPPHKGGDKGGDKLEAEADAEAKAEAHSDADAGRTNGPSFLAFWTAYPARLRTRQNEAIAAWSECMAEGHDPAAIVAKATEYGESPQGRSGFAVRAPRFLAARMFLDPPDAWQRGDEDKPKEKVYVPR